MRVASDQNSTLPQEDRSYLGGLDMSLRDTGVVREMFPRLTPDKTMTSKGLIGVISKLEAMRKVAD